MSDDQIVTLRDIQSLLKSIDTRLEEAVTALLAINVQLEAKAKAESPAAQLEMLREMTKL